jgi:hypothetical protein
VADHALAQGGGKPEIEAVRVGFGGLYKTGVWTPVEVTLRGDVPDGAELILTVPDGEGVPSRVYAPVRPGPICVRFGRVSNDLTVALRGGDAVLARRVFRAGLGFPAALPAERRVFLAVGPDPMGVEAAVGVLAKGTKSRITVARLEDYRQLPTEWYGYEGVSTVFLSASEPGMYAGLEENGPRVVALEEWVRMGGSLVFCVGRQAETVLEPGAPLARFAPGKLDNLVTLRQGRALETYAGSTESIASGNQRLEIAVPQLRDVEGRIEARDGNLPLVVRRAYGFGEIVFLAADPDLPPLSTWADRGRLIAQLLGRHASVGDEPDESTAIMHYGYTDMAGQLRSALDRFEGVRSVTFSLVVGLIVLYVLAIGPGDYFFVRKILRRMQLTWITFPLAIVLVSVAACVLANQFKGYRLRVNQVSMIDVDTTSGRIRGTSWANLFSPEMARYDVTFQPSLAGGRRLPSSGVLCSWLGLPGSALGGMDPKKGDAVTWKVQYRFAPQLDAMLGVPIPIWSTRSFTARWAADAEVYPAANLVEEEQLPVGTITNPYDFPLEDCLLAYGRWAYPLGTIEPGGSVDVGPTLTRRELRTLLTGQKMVYDETAKSFVQHTSPYDQAGTDPVYVLRAMALFDAAGGRRYTGLVNRYQDFVDLSHLLETDSAVLMALGPADASAYGARLVADGQPIDDDNPHPTVLRFVFPVKTASEE